MIEITQTHALVALAAIAIVCACITAGFALYDLWQAAVDRRRDAEPHEPGGTHWT